MRLLYVWFYFFLLGAFFPSRDNTLSEYTYFKRSQRIKKTEAGLTVPVEKSPRLPVLVAENLPRDEIIYLRRHSLPAVRLVLLFDGTRRIVHRETSERAAVATKAAEEVRVADRVIAPENSGTLAARHVDPYVIHVRPLPRVPSCCTRCKPSGPGCPERCSRHGRSATGQACDQE